MLPLILMLPSLLCKHLWLTFFMRTLTACDVPDAYKGAYRDIVTYFSSFQSQTWPEVTEGLKKMMLSYVPR